MSENEKKEITIINGDGKNLDISPVYEHIKPDNIPDDENKKKKIVIPKGSSDKNSQTS